MADDKIKNVKMEHLKTRLRTVLMVNKLRMDEFESLARAYKLLVEAEHVEVQTQRIKKYK